MSLESHALFVNIIDSSTLYTILSTTQGKYIDGTRGDFSLAIAAPTVADLASPTLDHSQLYSLPDDLELLSLASHSVPFIHSPASSDSLSSLKTTSSTTPRTLLRLRYMHSSMLLSAGEEEQEQYQHTEESVPECTLSSTLPQAQDSQLKVDVLVAGESLTASSSQRHEEYGRECFPLQQHHQHQKHQQSVQHPLVHDWSSSEEEEVWLHSVCMSVCVCVCVCVCKCACVPCSRHSVFHLQKCL